MSSYNLIGLMSGTSMDGLDIVFSTFYLDDHKKWKFRINNCKTKAYPENILKRLRKSIELSPVELLILDKDLGIFFANEVNTFLHEENINRNYIDAIASHGHTIYHQPEKGFTYQIGCGDTLAFHTKMNVINDFRQKDVVAGGQGAPLVPIGDKLLFQQFADSFLNIGGFANICFPGQPTVAFDICPANLPLNQIISSEMGLAYDHSGKVAKSGIVNIELLAQLNRLEFYKQEAPKSLGNEWLQEQFMPIIMHKETTPNILCTITEHIAEMIQLELNKEKVNSVYITGGGAKNNYLISRIKAKYDGKVIVPEDAIIDFKEALIFGFLGALYLSKQANTISSVTGAKHNTIGGVLHIP